MYLLVIAGIGFATVSNIMNKQEVVDSSPMYSFTSILFIYLTMFMIPTAIQGTSKGEMIFQMSDVNFLFVSPVSSRKILLYGILRLMKSSFLAGMFVLLMGNFFAGFGIGFGGVLLTFIGAVFSLVVLSVVSLVIYSITNGNKRRKLAAKIIIALLFLPALINFAVLFINTGDMAAVIADAVLSPFVAFVPVAGWMSTGISAFLLGDMVAGVMFFSANILLGVLLTAYIMLSKPDYYEDTLVSTETAYEKIRALSDGNLNAAIVSDGKVKVAKTGVKGIGATVLFHKHIRESFRESRLGFLTTGSLVICAAACAWAVITADLIQVLIILSGLQVFKISMGRGLKELYTHYVYMIPEPSFNKIIWSNMEVMFKTLVESVLIFGIAGVILRANAGVVLGCVAVYTMFSLLLVGSNYLYMRFYGERINKGLLIVFYYVGLLIIMAPGLVPAIIIAQGIEGNAGVIAALGIVAVWELAAGALLFALSKGVLHNCDMPTIKTDI
jgi:hypothetical protein